MHDEREEEGECKASIIPLFLSAKLAPKPQGVAGEPSPRCSSHIEEREPFLSHEPLVLRESIVGEPVGRK
jgi:hypothetical protein